MKTSFQIYNRKLIIHVPYTKLEKFSSTCFDLGIVSTFMRYDDNNTRNFYFYYVSGSQSKKHGSKIIKLMNK